MPTPLEPPPQDLGFGSVVGAEHERRLLNRDGSFNVQRRGLPAWTSLSAYHALLTMTWPRFLALLVVAHLGANALFAFGYMACGPGALGGQSAASLGGRYWQAFFFSVHTFATIGYGSLAPVGVAANLLVTAESLVGLLGFALATGVLFARFARPVGLILFSARAVIAPYRGGSAFMFRIANGRSNQLIGLQATVLLSRIEGPPGARSRKYTQLALERSSVVFFPLSWTIVHPIDAESPFFGLTVEELRAREAEVLIFLTGTDETFAQTVHARSSYRAEEITFGARFANIYNPRTRDGTVSIDVSRLGDIVPAALDGTDGLPMETATWRHTGHFAEALPPEGRS